MSIKGWIGVAIIALCLAALILPRILSFTTRYYNGPISDHWNGKRFYLSGIVREKRPPFAMLKWQWTRAKSDWPDSVPVQQSIPEARVEKLRVTFLGHAALLIQNEGKNILVDPVYSERASPFSSLGPKRARAPGVAFESLPPIDLVIVTHNHYDHLDLDTLERLWATHHMPIVTPLGNDTIIHRRIPEAEITTIDWQEEKTLPNGIALACLPVQHWSARWTWDRNYALWGAFVLRTSGGPIYLTGDTGYNARFFQEAAARFGPFRLATLPIGAYAPRWFMKFSHMAPEESVQAIADLKTVHAFPIHFGTFRLSDEPFGAPEVEWKKSVQAQGLPTQKFPVLEVGQAWDVPPVTE